MKMRIRLFHGLRAMLAAVFAFVFAVQAQAATLIDIYGPGQNQINLSMATPLTAPEPRAVAGSSGAVSGVAMERLIWFWPGP